MADNDLQVIVKAKELAVHSFKLTSNCNRYPKKYRHSLVDRIQVKSLDIYDTLMEASGMPDVNTPAWPGWSQTGGSAKKYFRLHTGRGKTTFPTETAFDWDKQPTEKSTRS